MNPRANFFLKKKLRAGRVSVRCRNFPRPNEQTRAYGNLWGCGGRLIYAVYLWQIKIQRIAFAAGVRRLDCAK